MNHKNYDDVVEQLESIDLLLDLPLRLATGKTSVRCKVDGMGSEKRGWYRLHEWIMDNGDSMLVGSYGIYTGDDPGTRKVELTKRCNGCGREMSLGLKKCPGCGSVDITKRELTDEQKAAIRAKQAEDKKRQEAERQEEIDRASRWASAVWKASRDVKPGDHDYPDRKKLQGLGGLRIFESNDGVKLDGCDDNDYRYLASFHGSLVVPMRDVQGKVFGLQFVVDRKKHAEKIKRDGRDKHYWPAGLSKDGHFHLIGPMPTGLGLIAEGYATAQTLHDATGLPVAVAFDAGNLPKVAKALKKHYRRTRWLTCADDDWLQKCKECGIYTPVTEANCRHCGKPHGKSNAGIQRAQEAALAVDGAWVAPVFESRPDDRKGPTDFNDLAVESGLDAVRLQIEAKLSALKWAPNQPASPRPEAGASTRGEGGNLRRDAVSIMAIDDIVERFIPLDDGTGDYVFDTWRNCIAKRSQMVALLPAGERADEIKRHPLWISRGAYFMDQVGFDPTGKDKNIKLNTWRGFDVDPVQGETDYLVELVYFLCSKERNAAEAADFILDWMAYQVQHPGVKLESAIIMAGGQGSGKSTLFNLWMWIFGQYGKKLNQRALEDKFNSDWAENSLAVLCEEIAANSDVWHVKGEVKDLITGEFLRANEKNAVARTVRNRMNFAILSNETIPIPLERDDRRFLVVRTPPALDKRYYSELYSKIENGGREAFFYYLKHERDISGFHPKSRPPMTDSKRQLICASSPSEQVFIEEWLDGGIEFSGKQLPVCPCTTTQLHTAYARWARRALVARPRDANQFSSFLNGLHGWIAGNSTSTYDNLNSAEIKNRRMVIPAPEAFARAQKLGVITIDQGHETKTRWMTLGYFAFHEALEAFE